MDYQKLKDRLIEDEGCVLHAYRDSLGLLTIGVGRLIDARRNGGISQSEAMALLDADIKSVELGLVNTLGFWASLDGVRQRALMSMAFQLGVPGLLKFKNMLAAIEAQKWDEAGRCALNSLWASQTPHRAARTARMLVSGSD